MKSVAWFDCPEFDWHEGPFGHPERPDRQRAIRAAFEHGELRDKIAQRSPRPLDRALLLQAHAEEYVDRVQRLSAFGGAHLDPDTYVKLHSFDAALLAAGAVHDAVQAVLEGEFQRAFCSVRPPGHHAGRSNGMGFCLFNNVVVGALSALEYASVQRVAIIDFDVHHGNGTEELTYDRGDIFFASSHQYPAYPGTGEATRRGRGAGAGCNLNVPLTPGSGDTELLAAWDERIRPVLAEYDPQIFLISAGFDGDARDPLAELRITTEGYAELSSRIVQFADETCAGRVVSTLEGGYNLDALAEDVCAHVATFL